MTQDAKGLTVTDSLHPRRNYPLDGKPRTVALDTGIAKATVTAGVQGETLTIGLPDGKTLTIARTRELPAAKQSSKEIYTRKQPRPAAPAQARRPLRAPRCAAFVVQWGTAAARSDRTLTGHNPLEPSGRVSVQK